MATNSQTPRWSALGLALMALMLSLSACQTPLDGTASAHTEAVVVSTGVVGSSSSLATPSVPPFTLGVWTSNSSPQARDTITIYILCMMQDQTTGGPSAPASGVHLRIQVHAPINQTYSATTADDGTAAVRVKFDDKHPGSPVSVDVTATWQGSTYQTQTYFTPAPQGTVTPTATPSEASATPDPNGDPSLPSGTPTTVVAPPTPTPAPPALPTPTTPPQPTPTDPIAP